MKPLAYKEMLIPSLESCRLYSFNHYRDKSANQRRLAVKNVVVFGMRNAPPFRC
ncbi:MAG: hypothetical protein ACOCPM_02005 [Bacteroidales bacterium]